MSWKYLWKPLVSLHMLRTQDDHGASARVKAAIRLPFCLQGLGTPRLANHNFSALVSLHWATAYTVTAGLRR